MLKRGHRIIRLGGQSKCSELDNFNLKEVKKSTMEKVKTGPYIESNYFYFHYQMVEVSSV